MRFIGGVIGFVKDESANGVGTCRSEVGESTVYAEPGSESNEVVGGGGEVLSSGHILRNEVILLVVAGGIAIDVGNIEKTLDKTVASVGIS